MKILAFDPAEKFGWAIGDKDSNQHGMWDFKLKRDENFAFKLIRFKEKLTTMYNAEKPDFIVYERVSGINSAAIASHSKFVAIIEVFCTENDIPFKGYSATEIKKHATGKGNAKKQDMLKVAIRKYGYRGADDNVADAICLLKFAIEDNEI